LLHTSVLDIERHASSMDEMVESVNLGVIVEARIRIGVVVTLSGGAQR
jgi:hypothetical protein